MSGCLAVWQEGVLFSCSTVLRSGHRHSRQHMTAGSANKNGRTATHSAASTPPVSTARSSVSSCLSSSRLNRALRNCRSSDSTGGEGCADGGDFAVAATGGWAAAVDAEEVFSAHLASLSRRTRAFHKRLANAVRLLLNMNIKHVNAASHLVATTSADPPNRILRWSAGGRRDTGGAAVAPWYVIAACAPRFPDASVSGRPLLSVRRRPRRCRRRRRRRRYNAPLPETTATTTTAASTELYKVVISRGNNNSNATTIIIILLHSDRVTDQVSHHLSSTLNLYTENTTIIVSIWSVVISLLTRDKRSERLKPATTTKPVTHDKILWYY